MIPDRHPASAVSQGSLDRGFLLVLILGGIAIVIADEIYRSSVYAEIAPVLLMLAYASCCRWFGTYSGREDRLGDNLYYLGFLFTLFSLSMSLMLFNRDQQIGEVLVRNFGIALITTIIGLILRTVFYQLRGDSDEEPLQYLQLLAEAAESAAGAVEGAGRRIQQSSEAFTAGMQQSLDGLRRRVDGVGSAVDGVTKNLEDLCARVSKIDIPTDLIANKLAPLAGAINASLQTVAQGAQLATNANDRLTAALGQLETGTSRTTAAMEGLSRVGERLGALAAILDQICKQLDSIADRLKSANNTIVAGAASSADTLTVLAKRASSDTEIAAQHREGLHSELARARAMVGELSEAQRPMAAALRERAEAEAKHATMYGDVLDAELKRSQELSAKLHDNAVSLIEFISKNLPDDQLRNS